MAKSGQMTNKNQSESCERGNEFGQRGRKGEKATTLGEKDDEMIPL